jgi:serine/threonine protein kinase
MLQKRLGREKFVQTAACLIKYDAREKALYFESGVCSLAEFALERQKAGIYWFERQNELAGVFCQLYVKICTLRQIGCYHGDLKPQNIVLFENTFNLYTLKLIDLGSCQFTHEIVMAMTPRYFPDLEKHPKVLEDPHSRFLAECYQLARLVQELCLQSIYESESRAGNLPLP